MIPIQCITWHNALSGLGHSVCCFGVNEVVYEKRGENYVKKFIVYIFEIILLWILKLNVMRQTTYVTCIERMISAYKTVVQKYEVRRYFGELVEHWKWYYIYIYV